MTEFRKNKIYFTHKAEKLFEIINVKYWPIKYLAGVILSDV